MGGRIVGLQFEGYSGIVADVDANRRQLVRLPDATTPANVGAARMFSENDPGTVTGTPYLASPETDDDSRLRVAHEAIFDSETFNYTAQNTGKFAYRNTTMAVTWSAAGLTTNSGNIVTTTTGVLFNSLAEFPIIGASHLYGEFTGSFNATPTTNAIIDVGLFRAATSNPFAPSDGVYFRLNSAGLNAVINHNGTENVQLLDFTYEINRKYQFIITLYERETEFWIDGVLYASISTPIGQGQPCMSSSLPFSLRHAITGGAAGAALSFVLNDYTVSLGGPNIALTASIMGQRIYGSYQGLSGGTMGSLATLPNSTNPTAATGVSNTALGTNLPGGLGGQGLFPAQAAAATDLIFGSYQVPAGTPNVQGRRLVIRGVIVDAVNIGAAVATTATTIKFILASGHTAVSLATAEAAAAKAPRREALGYMTWPVGAAIGAGPQAGPVKVDFGDAPVFVNPNEFVALVGRFIVGTATASQTIDFMWQPIYGWE
jgi:hypothetical protein